MGKCNQLKKLTRKDLIKGSDLALQNAVKLIESADLLTSRYMFGHANSLVILGVEEGIKSFVLYLYAIFSPKQEKLLCEVFTKHKAKHEVWAFIEMLNTMISMFIAVGQLYKDLEEQKVVKTEDCGSLSINEATSILKQWADETANPLQEIKEWYLKANNKKNVGFYVDYIDQKWVNPLDLCEEDYLLSKKHAKKLISNLEELKKINQSEFTSYVEKIKAQ